MNTGYGKKKNKQGNNFDVTMGSLDGAETAETVALYFLHLLRNCITDSEVGIYRDDGLLLVHEANGPKVDRIRKKIIKVFKDNGLTISIESNLTVTDFLDVTLDLENEQYYPYRKPNNHPIYVSTSSNHPPSVIKEIPHMIENRISKLSCNKEEFERVKPFYQNILKESGYDYNISYQETNPSPSNIHKNRRKRKITWFNPPFSLNVKTQIGKKFFGLINKHFPKDHIYHKIINKNTIKISYSCLPNIENIIKSHNRSIVTQKQDEPQNRCSCRIKSACPLNGNCLAKEIVYEATLETSQREYKYTGLTEAPFKTRYANHKQSFKNKSLQNATELSKLVWNLKDQNAPYSLSWKILAKKPTTSAGKKGCNLCTEEKMHILK